jgi:serine protease
MYALQGELITTRTKDVWPATLGTGVVVAVLDTGIDADHPELAGQLVNGYNAFTQTATANGDFSVVDDGHGHGTHVAGTIAALTDNGVGIAGAAPAVKIMPVKVLSDYGGGTFDVLVDGLNWAVANGADVVNLSLGGTLGAGAIAQYQPYFTAARNAGVTVVAAAGNTGSSSVLYPCAFDYVLCVASSNRAGTAISSFSTRNAYVDITAPGEAIRSTLPGGNYASWSGTSMATPQVAAAAGLFGSLNPAFTPDQTISRLISTAADRGAAGRDNLWGWGLLDTYAAVGNAPLPPAPQVAATAPAAGASDVPRDAKVIVTFDQAVSGVSATSVSLLLNGARVKGTVAYDPATFSATLTPRTILAPGSYTVQLSGAINSAGSALTPTSYTFSVGSDVTAPGYVANPPTGATGVNPTATLTVTFNEAVRTIDSSMVVLRDTKSKQLIAVSFAFDAQLRQVSLTPSAPLLAGRRYQVEVAAVRDLAGNTLKAFKVVFTTAR